MFGPLGDWRAALDQWTQQAASLIHDQGGLPLIDMPELDRTEELTEAWMGGAGDLRAATEDAVARNPCDISLRWAVLSAYYELTNFQGIEKEEFVENQRKAFLDELGFLVRLREVHDCADVRAIQWEIVNACAVTDYDRALELASRLKEFVSAGVALNALGRLYYLVAFAIVQPYRFGEGAEWLAKWNLPLGVEINSTRAIARRVNNIRFLECLQNSASENVDKSFLRNAIAVLEGASDALGGDMPALSRLMLARSYMLVGDAHNSAVRYRWMVDHRKEFIQQSFVEMVLLPELPEDAADIGPSLYRCLIAAHEAADETDEAIRATGEFIEACPDEPGTFNQMSRLYLKNADYEEAYRYLRKEANRNPKFGENPHISIALAIGSITSTAAIDDAINKIVSSHPDEQRLAAAILPIYWSTFSKLGLESQQRWAYGTWLMSSARGNAGLAAHCFAWVLEREVRETIFAPYKATRPTVFAKNETESPFLARYLLRGDLPSLGQMLTLLRHAKQPSSKVVLEFATWLSRTANPRSALTVDLKAIDRIVSVRNREDHANPLSITNEEAEAMARDSRGILDLLHAARP